MPDTAIHVVMQNWRFAYSTALDFHYLCTKFLYERQMSERKRKINPFVVIYLIAVFVPVGIAVTVVFALVTIVMSTLFGDKKWGYWPGMVWARITCYLALVRVRVSGRENYDHGQSYIFVANHQSIFDIFLIYGWLDSKFKWIMKKELRKIPFVGKACECAGHIFIDRSSAMKAHKSMVKAEERLRNGVSVVIFPEGTRTRDGNVGRFKRGAFAIAADLHLPVVPITIKGAYETMPYHALYVRPGVIEMKIHKPIDTSAVTHENIGELIAEAHEAIAAGLD